MDETSNEEVRKIQLTGGSTYIVSLPKNWVEKTGLKRGSVVSISEADDLSLTIHPKRSKKDEKLKRAAITVSDDMSPESLVRRVISTYLIGYNIIQLKNPEKRIDPTQRYTVKEFARNKLVGTEILSDLPNELVMQVLLSHSELSINDALRRMAIIASSMHRDAIYTLRGENPQLAREVISMDDEVDRFSLYIIRLLKAAVSDGRVLKEVRLNSPRECLGYRLITKSVERMADHAVNIAHNSLALTPSNLGNEVLKELKSLSDRALKVFEDSIEQLFERNYAAADKVMEKAEEIRRMEMDVIQKIIKNAAQEDVPALRLIVESILRTAEYGSDIAETVLNMTITREIKEG
ncbi:MAG: PhoU domain-containing protein [Candidatus Bathyarchaeia archaeon]